MGGPAGRKIPGARTTYCRSTDVERKVRSRKKRGTYLIITTYNNLYYMYTSGRVWPTFIDLDMVSLKQSINYNISIIIPNTYTIIIFD